MKKNRFGAYYTNYVKIIPYRHHQNSLLWLVKVLIGFEEQQEFALVADNSNEAAYLGLKAYLKKQKETSEIQKQKENKKLDSLEAEYQDVLAERK